MRTAVLYTIPFSHYCEKARWALEHARVAFEERGHLPALNRLFTPRFGGSTVPLLVTDEGSFADSTDIVAFADQRAIDARRLLPDDSALREDALAIEDRFDKRLGVASRAWAYSFLLDDTERLAALASQGIPRWEALAVRPLRGALAGLIRKGLRIGPTTRAWGTQRVQEDLDFVEARLAQNGGRYLVGDRFTVADLTFASLAAPAVFPLGYGGPLPTVDELPAAMQPQARAWQQSVAGQFALRIYREHRAMSRDARDSAAR
jgi:glutathione S-transferase